MENKDIITSLVLFISPAIGIILSTTSLLNIGKKDLSELFEKIKKYIQKRKIQNIIKIMFPKKIGINKEEEWETINEDNMDSLKILSKEIDSVSFLEKSLFFCKRYSDYLFYSFFVIIFFGVIHFVLYFVHINIPFISNNFFVINIVIIVYVFLGIFTLIHKKKKLEDLYEKEYDI